MALKTPIAAMMMQFAIKMCNGLSKLPTGEPEALGKLVSRIRELDVIPMDVVLTSGRNEGLR